MIVQFGYVFLLIACVSVCCGQDEKPKTHVGECDMKRSNRILCFCDLAIIGAGIGGVSAGYWLKHYLNDSVAITIYESDQVCEIFMVRIVYSLLCRLEVD